MAFPALSGGVACFCHGFRGTFTGFLYPFDLRLHQTGDADFCTDFDFAGCNLAIFAVTVKFTALLHFAVPGVVGGSVVFENIQGNLASVEAFVAGFCGWFFVFLSDLVLESPALEILIEAFVGLNYITHCLILSDLSPAVSRVGSFRRSASCREWSG